VSTEIHPRGPDASPDASGALTEEETLAIRSEASHYPNKQAACIDALKIVQDRRGWVSDEALRGIAEALDMSAEQLDSVATFYNLIFRRPVGRHVVFVCDSISCWVCGGENARETMEKKLGARLGETSADGRFTLLPICCLGACDRAPVALVDGDLHARLNEESVDAILQRYE
jgi:NADH-quinone oxidoreductase subunit E